MSSASTLFECPNCKNALKPLSHFVRNVTCNTAYYAANELTKFGYTKQVLRAKLASTMMRSIRLHARRTSEGALEASQTLALRTQMKILSCAQILQTRALRLRSSKRKILRTGETLFELWLLNCKNTQNWTFEHGAIRK